MNNQWIITIGREFKSLIDETAEMLSISKEMGFLCHRQQMRRLCIEKK